MFGGPQRTRPGTRAEQEEKWRDVRRGEGTVARTGRSVLARESRGKGRTDRGGPSGDHGGRSLGDRLWGPQEEQPASRVFQGLRHQI